MNIVVCVATCRRPQFLAHTLCSLRQLHITSPLCRLAGVVVVDNDAGGSAADTVRAELGFVVPVVYEIEPRRGIPFARNRAVELARRLDPDAIAFIDDDEVAEPPWLESLAHTMLARGAAVVQGFVRPELEEGKSHWLLAAGFYDRVYPASGAPLQTLSTNNLLIRLDVLPNSPFETALGNMGVDDTDLGFRLRSGGHSIVMCREAVVRETIPKSRCSIRWLVQRSFRGGLTYSSCAIRNGRATWSQRIGQALFRVVQGGAAAVVAPVLGRVAVVRALRTVALGVGGILGCFKIRYEEYSTIHGH